MMLESRNSAHGATAIEDRAGYSLALVVGAGGIVASVIVALLVGRLLTEQARTDFRTQADSWKTSLQKTLHANLIVLDQFKAFFAASRQVEPEEFTLYAQCIRTNHPTVVALEYARCVPRSARPHFEASHTNESGQPLIIGQMLAPEVRTLIPAYDRDVYFPVEFIVGEPRDGLLHGFDLMSEPVRAHALQRALETGSAVATTGIRLRQQTDATLSFLVFLPIPKQPPLAPSADAPPWARSDGVVAAAFNVSKLVQAAVWDEQFLRALRIDEVTSSPPGSASTGAAAPHPQPIFRASAPADQDRPRHPDWIYESLLNVDGHDTLWNLTFTPTPAMLRFRPAQSIGGTLAIGLLVTGLVVSRLITSARCTVAAYRTNRQLQEALASEESALREASHFDAITQKISSGWSLHQILDYVYESFIALLPYDRITFAVLEKDGREARSVWSRSRGQHGKSPDEYRTSLEGSSLDELLKQGQPRVLDELSSFLESHPSSRTTRLLIEDGMRSSMTCPLTANGRTVGFLSFSCRRPNAYNEAHVQRFARVARQVSVTVERARYCEELEAEMGLRRKAERALRRVYEAPRDRYQTGGSLRHDSPSYVERSDDFPICREVST